MKASRGNGTSNHKVPNLERALIILEYLVAHPRPFGLSELAGELAFPKNSVYRIMNTLRAYGYVDRDEETLRYTVTKKLFSMAYGTIHQKNLMENSMDVMRDLRDEIGETVVISIMDGDEGLVLEQVQGIHSFRFVCDPGTRQVPHTSASCKAVLAFMPDDRRDDIIDAMDFRPYTAKTVTDRGTFEEELETIRRRGYAVDYGEFQDGVHCVAVPVLDRRGHPVAAITVTGPSNRMPASSFEQIGAAAMRHTARISTRNGHGLQPENMFSESIG